MTAVDLDALDAARAAATREALRDELAGWPIGDGYYSTSIGIGEAGELADFLLAGSIAPLIAEARRYRALREAVEGLAEPGDPSARMDAYYYGFERTGVGIVDAILSAVAQAGKSYHGTDMWAEEDEWTTPSHEARIQATADAAAAALRAALVAGDGGAE